MSAAGATGYIPFAISAALVYCGVGLLINVPTTMIIEALPAAKQGVGSAINDLTRELGAAFGIAIAGSAFNSGYRTAVAAPGELPVGRVLLISAGDAEELDRRVARNVAAAAERRLSGWRVGRLSF